VVEIGSNGLGWGKEDKRGNEEELPDVEKLFVMLLF